MRVAVLSVLLFVANALHAQDSLSAKVIDAKSEPLSFVSVVLLQQGKTIASTATNDRGYFVLPGLLERGISYAIRFSLVGYVPVTKTFTWPDSSALSPVTMPAGQTTLGNVTVTTKKPLVTHRTDRFIINVENSFLANGNSGLDVLQRSPGLWVDNTGNIRIRSNQSVMVMINDVVQRMSQDELAEYLRTLRSEDISRIEVIPNPPAEYEAAGSGGIVHIILKKARKDGLNGYAFGQYRQQGREPSGNIASSLDYKSGKLYLLGGFSISKDVSNSFGHTENSFTDQSSFNTIGTRHIDNARQQYRLGFSYELSKNSSLTVQSMSNATQMHHFFYNDVTRQNAGKTETGTNTTDWTRKPQQNSTSAVYAAKTDTLGSSFKIVADYTSGKRDEVNALEEKYTDPAQNSRQVNTTPSKTSLFSIQSDLTQVFGKDWIFRTGAKFALVHRDNNVIIEDVINGAPVLNAGKSNHFKYSEDIAMFYTAVEKSAGRMGYKLGLRGEQTYSNGNSITSGQRFSRKYFGLFPSLFITRAMNDDRTSDVYFSYARRLQRPGFDELNPYRLQLNNVITMLGNPDLQPQYTNNFELGYHFAKGWTGSLYYSRTTGVISQVSVPVGNLFEIKYYNLDQTISYGLNFDAPVKIKEGWMLNNSFSLFHAYYTLQSVDYTNTTFAIRHGETIQLKKLFDIDWSSEYSSPYVRANSHVKDFFYLDIGFSKKIMKGKGRVRLYFSDILNKTREAASTAYLGTYTAFYQKRQTQNISVSFSYNFSVGKKFNNKKIEAGSTEEKSRI